MSKDTKCKKVTIEFVVDAEGLTSHEEIVLVWSGIGVPEKLIALYTGLSLDNVHYCKKNIKIKKEVGQIYRLCKDHKTTIK